MPELDLQTMASQQLNQILLELCGEENINPGLIADGDPFTATWFGGVPMMFTVESIGEELVFINARHTVGTRVEDRAAASNFIARRNQNLRIGRLELCESDVDFTFQLFASGLNKETVRWVLRLLASEADTFADLAAATGALKLTDYLALQRGEEEK